MIFDKGLRKKSRLGVAARTLTLESADGWDLDNVSMSTDRALKVSTVYRCVDLLSTSMAMLPVYIMRETDKARLPEHRLCPILWGRANEAMTSVDYTSLMKRNVLLRGNAYAYIERDPATGWPVELIPLEPDLTAVWFDGAGRHWYMYANPRTGEPTRLYPEDVLHYKGPSSDGITGVSVLTSASMTITTALAAQQHQTDLYTNGGQPSGVLTVDTDLGGTTEETDDKGNTQIVKLKDVVRREWEKAHGPGRAFRVAILDHGLKYEPIGLSNSDAQFVESEDVRVADICRFFGTPTHLVFAGKQSYQSNEQNSLEFVRYTLQGDVTRWEQEDTRKLLLPSEREAGLRVKREMKVFLRGDTAAQGAWYKAMREAGVYSVNDIRALEDLPAVPGGDTRYSSLNYVPLELFSVLSELRARSGGSGGAADERGDQGGTDNNGG